MNRHLIGLIGSRRLLQRSEAAEYPIPSAKVKRHLRTPVAPLSRLGAPILSGRRPADRRLYTRLGNRFSYRRRLAGSVVL